MADDAALRKAFADWLATRPKAMPRASRGVLERAERRLIGSIKHQEPRTRLIADAERVRRAQLGWLKASLVAAALPTDAETDVRRSRRTNLAEAQLAWEHASVDDIVELYQQHIGTTSAT